MFRMILLSLVLAFGLVLAFEREPWPLQLLVESLLGHSWELTDC